MIPRRNGCHGAGAAPGGNRPGSGRKKGQAQVRSQEIAAKLLKDGKSAPLDVMVEVMRRLMGFAEQTAVAAEEYASGACEGDAPDVVTDKIRAFRKEEAAHLTDAASVARDCAPFLHPRLHSVDSKTSGSLQVVIRRFTEEDDAANIIARDVVAG